MSRFLLYKGESEDENKISFTEIIKSHEECRYKVNEKCFCNGDWKKLGKVCHFEENTCEFYKHEEEEEN